MWFAPNVTKMKERGDIAGLVKALRYKEWSIREAAAHALGDLRAKAAVEALGNLVQAEKNPYVGLTFAKALTKIGDEEGLPYVVDLALFADIDKVRMSAGQLLPEFGASALLFLTDALWIDDLPIARRAAETLVFFGAGAVPALAAVLEGKVFAPASTMESNIRAMQTRRRMAGLGFNPTILVAMGMLTATNGRIDAAADALRRINDIGGHEALRTAANSESEPVRLAANKALGIAQNRDA